MLKKKHELKSGEKFNLLTVIEFAYNDSDRGVDFYRFKCDCGNETIKNKKSAVNGLTKSCGCLRKKSIFKNCIHEKLQSGTIFGWLSIVNYSRYENSTHYYACECKCGVKKEIKWDSLRNGTQSCGCRKNKKNFDHQRFVPIPENTQVNELTVLSFSHMR